MSIGMSYKEFWYASPYLVQTYRKADEYRQDRMSQEAWLQGFYIYNAFAVVLSNSFGKGKKEKYTDAIRLRKKTKLEIAEEAEKERQKITAYFDTMIAQQNERKKQREVNDGGNDC